MNNELQKSIPVAASNKNRKHQPRRLSGTKGEIEIVQKSALYRMAIAEVKRLADMNLAYVTRIRELQTTLAILQEMLADAQANQKEIVPEDRTIDEIHSARP